MATFKLMLLPGDGIGVEVMREMEKITAWLTAQKIVSFETETDLAGGASLDAHKLPITDAVMARALKADAVFMGAVGGPKWAGVAFEHRPEVALLRMRADLDVFANLRPALCYPALVHASSLKPELVEGLDILIVRELTGGVYYREPKEIVTLENGEQRATDTQIYTTSEIERLGKVAFELAKTRRNKVSSAEKHNVMKSGILWKQVLTRLGKDVYPDVQLEHVLADNCAMQLVRQPKQFDVIATDNLFGDILSDIAAMMTGSLGMLPSASLGNTNPATGRRFALYEPVHGSAPDIAGKGIANPLAMIGSLAMALRYSFERGDVAEKLEKAILTVLDKGIRTEDIAAGHSPISTSAMGDAVLKELQGMF